MMAEWHVPPDYIINNWTEEMLELMSDKLVERKERENQALRGSSSSAKVSDATLFNQAGNLIKVVKRN